jgi:hypothetical protein
VTGEKRTKERRPAPRWASDLASHALLEPVRPPALVLNMALPVSIHFLHSVGEVHIIPSKHSTTFLIRVLVIAQPVSTHVVRCNARPAPRSCALALVHSRASCRPPFPSHLAWPLVPHGSATLLRAAHPSCA